MPTGREITVTLGLVVEPELDPDELEGGEEEKEVEVAISASSVPRPRPPSDAPWWHRLSGRTGGDDWAFASICTTTRRFGE
jgi:hypothetical protein